MADNNSSEGRSASGENSGRLGRRTFLYTSGAASVAALAGCTGNTETTPTDESTPTESSGGGGGTSTTSKTSKPFEGEKLKAAVWSGEGVDDWRNELVPPFEEKTGAEVEIVPVWAEITSKIKSAPKDDPPFDVTVGDGYVHLYGVQGDLFQKVRYENIPNFEDVYQYLKDFRPHEYGVPTSGMPMTILYREDQPFKPTSWAQFGSQAGQQAKLGMEGSWYAYPAHISALTMDQLPKAGEMYDEQYHQDVFDTLQSWDVNKWYGGGAEFWEALRNGVVDAAQYYMNTHKTAQKEENIGFAYPEDGSVWYWDHHHVVRGTDHRRLAEEWINHILDPEIQSKYADLIYIAPANKKATLERKILKDNYPQSNSEWEEKAVFFDVPYLSSHYQTFTDMFKRVKQQS